MALAHSKFFRKCSGQNLFLILNSVSIVPFFLLKKIFHCTDAQEFLVVLWLGLGAFTAGVQIQSLLRELRSRKPHDAAKKKKKTLSMLKKQLLGMLPFFPGS